MNEAYSQLAVSYDNYMEEVPYEKWLDFIEKTWAKFNLEKPETILDLCCGTGTMTVMLKKLGYNVLGVDNSCDMLAQASKKAVENDFNIPFFEMDMIEFQLRNKVDCVICCCDGLNYNVEDGELKETFQRVNENLEDNGVFIFDLNTEYKFKEILGDKQYSAVEENSAYFWQNEYDEEEKVNTYYVSLFKQVEGDTYQRFEEYHWERAYNIVETQKYLSETGFQVLGVFDNYDFSETCNTTERYVFITKKI